MHQVPFPEDECCTWIEVRSRYSGVTVVAVKVLGNDWRWQTSGEDIDAAKESACRIVIAPARSALGFDKPLRNAANFSFSVEIIPAKCQRQKKAGLASGCERIFGAEDENPILRTITEFARKEDLFEHALGY